MEATKEEISVTVALVSWGSLERAWKLNVSTHGTRWRKARWAWVSGWNAWLRMFWAMKLPSGDSAVMMAMMWS
eukprot:scaffold21158_cov71-Cyclotella_meneghiniana.AAC.4